MVPRASVRLAAVVPPTVVRVAFPVPVMPPRDVTVLVAPLVPSVTPPPVVGPRGPGAQREQPDDGRGDGPFPHASHATAPPAKDRQLLKSFLSSFPYLSERQPATGRPGKPNDLGVGAKACPLSGAHGLLH